MHLCVALIVTLIPLIFCAEIAMGVDVEIVTREQWGARPPKGRTDMTNPVPFVIIHHSYIPGACWDFDNCTAAMRYMQDMHMDDNGWDDIGYSFLVGSDNRVYTGRGWSTVGAHAPNYNVKSIGICFIGDYQIELPPSKHLAVVKKLIQMGVDDGYIESNYTLLGHRQTRPTECPGQRLYDEISTWPHYSPIPEPLPHEKFEDPKIVSREEWGALAPKEIIPIKNPVPMVVITHSFKPRLCRKTIDCVETVREMQKFHMTAKQLNDVAYNFIVGGDYKVYEGTGWSNAGSHSRGYNNITIGICFLGDFTNDLPPALTINAAKDLISYGVRHGYINKDYILVGHRQLIQTQSPGDRLQKEINTWPQYSKWSAISTKERDGKPPKKVEAIGFN